MRTVADPVLPVRPAGAGAASVVLQGVSVHRGGARPLLRDIDWTVRPGEHWAVLGANGSGKTTLLHVVGGVVAPSSGDVTVLGEPHGAPGLRDPRMRIATVDAAPRTFAAGLTATGVVVLRASGPPAVRGARVRPEEVEHARALLELLGCGRVLDRRYATCSQGERQRILVARALLREPAIVLLDEPATGLDLPGRAAFLHAMTDLASARPELATITVSHHIEELPQSTTHALLLREGMALLTGPVQEVMTGDALSACFGVPVAVSSDAAGWTARVRRPRW